MKDLVVLVGVIASAAAGAPLVGGEFARPGEWACQRAKDGSPQAVLGVVSDEKNGMLLVRCSSGRPTISLKWGYYASSRPTSITTRLDHAAPALSWWPASIYRMEAQYPGDHAAYLGALRQAKTLALRLTPDPVPAADAASDGVIHDVSPNMIQPAVDPPLEMTFDLSGLGTALQQAQGSCEPQ